MVTIKPLKEIKFPKVIYDFEKEIVNKTNMFDTYEVTAEEISQIIPRTLKVKTDFRELGYRLVDCIGFLRKDYYLTLALDFKMDKDLYPASHYDPSLLIPNVCKDREYHLENSMTLTAFVTVNLKLPNKGPKTDTDILIYTQEKEMYVTGKEHPKGMTFNVSNASCVRLNRLGQYTNPYFCNTFREIFIEEDKKQSETYTSNGMILDMVNLYGYWRNKAYSYLREFLKSGIVYNRGISIGRCKEGKRSTTSVIDLDIPKVDTNIHILNNFYGDTIEPELLFPYYGRKEVWEKYDVLDSIYRLDIEVKEE